VDILRLENLSKYYTSQSSVVMGLTNINLSFKVGEFVAVTGESGSGKSTLAHILGGILPYESGEMYVEGNPTSHYDDSDRENYRKERIGFISQGYGILEGNTVLENIESALIFYGMDKDEARDRALDVLKEVDLFDLKSRRAGKLSSGQKQRLSIARALAKPSRILIADEPTGNLDRENSQKIISLLKKASKDRLVILITHDFDEARDYVTRRITIADGSVVSDIRSDLQAEENTVSPAPQKSKQAKKSPTLSLYTASLTVRSHPVFTAIACLFLAFTSFIVFAFLGTFTIALDDSSVKIYSSEAFMNGDPHRIVVMKPDTGIFTPDELEDILDIKYVESIERRGYISDINYYYVPDKDYRNYNFVINGPNYHPLFNPDDKQVTNAVEFLSNKRYMSTPPVADGEFLKTGRIPESAYEIVSADPDYKIGDTVKVYIRNRREWSVSSYFYAIFTVVGETDKGEGLIFSDKLAAALTNESDLTPSSLSPMMYSMPIMVMPFQPEHTDGAVTSIAVDEILISDYVAKTFSYVPSSESKISLGDTVADVRVKALYVPAIQNLILTSNENFEKLTDTSPSNQICITIKDYAYTDRVTDSLAQKGYMSISPFRVGSTETDSELANERYMTLGVCLGALVVAIVLQLIILRAIFSSLNPYFKLMSDVGLTGKTLKRALSLIIIICTAIGELLCAAALFILNGIGVDRISEIFKYLDTTTVLSLFAVHIISIFLAALLVIRSAKKALFVGTKRSFDLDMYEEGGSDD